MSGASLAKNVTEFLKDLPRLVVRLRVGDVVVAEVAPLGEHEVDAIRPIGHDVDLAVGHPQGERRGVDLDARRLESGESALAFREGHGERRRAECDRACRIGEGR